MKRTPPLPFLLLLLLTVSVLKQEDSLSLQPYLALKTHCSYCAATECNVSGVTVRNVRGCGLMVFDRQYPQCSSPSPGGPNKRPARHPDESFLFICAIACVRRNDCHVTTAKTIRSPGVQKLQHGFLWYMYMYVSTSSFQMFLFAPPLCHYRQVRTGWGGAKTQFVQDDCNTKNNLKKPITLYITFSVLRIKLTSILCMPLQHHKAGLQMLWKCLAVCPECSLCILLH